MSSELSGYINDVLPSIVFDLETQSTKFSPIQFHLDI